MGWQWGGKALFCLPPCFKMQCCWRACESSALCRWCGRCGKQPYCGSQKNRGNCSLLFIVFNIVSIIFLVTSAVALSNDFDAIKNTHWSLVTYSNTTSGDEMDVFIGLNSVAVSGTLDGSLVSDTALKWSSPDCSQQIAADICADCDSTAGASQTPFIMAIVTRLPQLAIGIGRSHPVSDTNCRRVFGWLSAIVGTLSILVLLSSYVRGCHDRLEDVAFDGVDVNVQHGPGFFLLCCAISFRVVDLVFHCYLATPKEKTGPEYAGAASFPGNKATAAHLIDAEQVPPGVRCLSDSPFSVCIGLEVHAQITAASKLFSGASADYGTASWQQGPNAAVSFFDAALPGTLPVVNKRCIEAAVLTGAALQCDIHPKSVFERKHYVYADLPLGFQITQLRHPIATGGCLPLTVPRTWKRGKGSAMNTFQRVVTIERIQIEQDSGKSNHTLAADATLVDLNRAGVGLLEIVTGPDLRSGAEAGAFLRALQRLLRHIGTCDGNMEEGSMRCDVNVSLRLGGDDSGAPMGQRVEMKNLNSVKSVMRAIEFEAERQAAVLSQAGGAVEAETRSFDAATGVTAVLRSKEDAPDYRFFPDPDLLPVELAPEYVGGVVATLPELPSQMQARFVREYGLAAYDASVLVAEVGAGEFFEEVLTRQRAEAPSPKAACNIVVNNLFGLLKESGGSLAGGSVPPAVVAELLDLLADGTISNKVAKDVLGMVVGGDGRPPGDIVASNGWSQIRDVGVLADLCQAAVSDPAHADMVAKYVGGNKRAFGFFVGKALAASGGRADPALLSALMKDALGAVAGGR